MGVDWLAEELIGVRRSLHQHPELSGEEFATTAYIRRRLEAAQIRIADYGLPTGVIAEVGKTSGPTVAIRADIDALPIEEKTALPFASAVPGRMHACGHDFHAAVVYGAALLLKQREGQLPGKVRFVFQPSEEKATGARQVLEADALEGVQAIFGLHNKPDLPTGEIGLRSGPLMAAADGFEVEVTGRGSHAAVPEAGLDPLITSAHMIAALQTIVSRNVSPLESVVLSVTRLHAGDAWNVIPERAVFDGTIRSFAPAVRSYVRSRFEQTVSGVAAAFGLAARCRWIDGPPVVINDSRWTQLARETAQQQGLAVSEPALSPAGEDFAFYLENIPGLFVFVGTNGKHEWHHPQFDVDERALSVAARWFARLAENALHQLAGHSLREE